jgi:P22 coat protein - gene protein 5
MANIVASTAAAAGFVPEIFGQEALEILRPNFQLAPRVTKDTEVASFNVGQVLDVPFAGTFVANDKVQGSPVTRQTPTGSKVQVTLNKHKEVTFLLEDFTRAISNPTTFQQYLKNTVDPLAQAVESDLFALYSSFTGSTGTTGTDLSASALRAVRKKFVDNKVAPGGRMLAVSTKDVAALQADSSLQSFFAYNDGRNGAVTQGTLPNIYGIELLESQLVPTVGSAPTSTKNLAFDRGAIILASRHLPLAPENVPVVQTVVQDPESGIVLRITMSYSADYLGVQVTLDVLYGVAVLRDAKGFTVLS